MRSASGRWQVTSGRHFKNIVAILWAHTFLSLVTCHLPLYASGEPDAFALTGIGARAGGMGNAFIGLSDEIESIYYNPAGLGNLIQSGATAMYQTPSIETSRGFVGFNKRWVHPRVPGSIGFGWLRLRSSDIELTSTDEKILGTDTLTNDLWILGAGVHPWAHWSVGASVKYFRFAFNGFSEGGFGADLGVHAQYNPFRFGLVMTDLGGTILKGASIDPNSSDARDRVPARLRPGVGCVIREPFNWPIHIALDVDGLLKLQGAQDARIFSGAEVWGFQDHAALRSGFEQGNGPTFGFGARVGPVQFDYSFLFSLNLRDEHRLGTTVRF
jgi:hypothetical protein